MVNEKKIEEDVLQSMNNCGAWYKCQIENEDTPYYNQEDVICFVKESINRFLNNLWHDGSDSPFYGAECLVELADENDSKCYAVAAEWQGGSWDRSVSELVKYDGYRITRWLYISDLLLSIHKCPVGFITKK